MIENIDKRIEVLNRTYISLKNTLYTLEKMNRDQYQEKIRDTVYQIIGVALELNEAHEQKYQLELQEINARETNSIYENQQKIEDIIELNNRRQAELDEIPELGTTTNNDIERLQNINNSLIERETLKNSNVIIENKLNDLQQLTDDFALLSDQLDQNLGVEITRLLEENNLTNVDSRIIHEDVNIAQMNINAAQSSYLLNISDQKAITLEERQTIRALSYNELDARMSYYEAREKELLIYIKELFDLPNESMEFLAEKRLVMLDYLNERKQMRIELGLQGQIDNLSTLEEMLTEQLTRFNEFRDRKNLERIYRSQLDKNNTQIDNLETILNSLGITALQAKVENNNKLIVLSNPALEKAIIAENIIEKKIQLYYDQDDNSIRLGLFENGSLVEAFPGNYQNQDRKAVVEAIKSYQRDNRYNDCSFDFRFPKEYQSAAIVLGKEQYQVSAPEEEKTIKVEQASETEEDSKKVTPLSSTQVSPNLNDPIFTDEERIESGYDYLTTDNAKNLNKIHELNQDEKSKILEAVPVVKMSSVPEKVKRFFIRNKAKVAAGLTALALSVGLPQIIAHAPTINKPEVPTPEPTIAPISVNNEIDDEYKDVLADIDEVTFGEPTKTPTPSVSYEQTKKDEHQNISRPVETPEPIEKEEVVRPIETPQPEAPSIPIVTPEPVEPIVTPEPIPPEKPSEPTESPVETPEPTNKVETPFVEDMIPNVHVVDENGQFIEMPTEQYLQSLAERPEVETPRRGGR